MSNKFYLEIKKIYFFVSTYLSISQYMVKYITNFRFIFLYNWETCLWILIKFINLQNNCLKWITVFNFIHN